MYKNHKVAVVVPVFEDAANIGSLISKLQALHPTNEEVLVDDIIVCHNLSNDRTGVLVEQVNCRVIHEPQPGYGPACLAAMAKLDDPDVVVFLDAYHSDCVTEIPALLDEIIAGNDLVIGSRVSHFRGEGSMCWSQRIGKFLVSFLIGLLWAKPVTDLGSFRAIRYSSLIWLNMQDRRYGWSIEMLVKAIQLGMDISEISVSSPERVVHSRKRGTILAVICAAFGISSMIFKLWRKEKMGMLKKIEMNAHNSI